MAYIDLWITPVFADRVDDFKKLAKKAANVWVKHGALSYCEFLGEDVKPGKVTSIPQGIKLKDTEVAVAAFMTFKSKAHRNKVWASVMADPFMKNFDIKNAPFDGSRMIMGGFQSVVMKYAQ